MFQARQDYKASYLGHMASPSNTATLSAYLDAHNNYVTQLHATNGMVETYAHDTLPLLLQVSALMFVSLEDLIGLKGSWSSY